MKFESATPLYEKASNFREAKRYTPQVAGSRIVAELVAVGLFLFLLLATAASIAWSFPWKWALLAATTGASLLFVVVLGYAFRENLLWIVEEVIGYDADQDGHIGQPPVEVHYTLEKGAGMLRMGQIDINPALLMDWCRAASEGRSLAFAAWEQRFALPDGTQGRERYTHFRNWLVHEGFAEEAGGNVGLRIRWQNQDAVAFVGGFAQMTAGEGAPMLEGRPQNE